MAGQAVTLSLRNRPERWGFLGYANTPFAPVVDGAVLPISPFDALRDGAASHVDLVVGFTRDEYQSFLFDTGALDRFGERDVHRARHHARTAGVGKRAVPAGSSGHGLVGAVLDGLLRRALPGSERPHRRQPCRGVDRRTDVSLRVRLALPHRRRTAGRPPFHRCPVRVRDPRQSLRPSLARARPRSGGRGPVAPPATAPGRRFAATGDPGWPAYRPDEPLALVWDVEDTVVHDPEAASRRIWRDHAFGAAPPLAAASTA